MPKPTSAASLDECCDLSGLELLSEEVAVCMSLAVSKARPDRTQSIGL